MYQVGNYYSYYVYMICCNLQGPDHYYMQYAAVATTGGAWGMGMHAALELDR